MSKSQGQRRLARRDRRRATAPTPRAATSCSSARPTRTPTGPTRASRACTASSAASGASAPRSPSARRPTHPVPDDAAGRRPARSLRKAQLGDRQGHRRHAGRFAFNTAIAAVMELINEVSRLRDEAERRRDALRAGDRRTRCCSRSPRTRAADGYDRLTGERVWEQPWPDADPALLERDTYELVCQVNGKVRDRVQAPRRRRPRRRSSELRARGAQRARPRRRPRDRQGRSSCRASSSTSSSRVTAPRLGVPIAVAGSAEADPPTLAAAEELGALLADAGFVVLTGGLGGVMEAASRGARSRLGVTVGILPGDEPRRGQRLGRARAADRPRRDPQRRARPRRARPRRDRSRLRHALRDRIRAQARAARRRARLLGHRRRRAGDERARGSRAHRRARDRRPRTDASQARGPAVTRPRLRSRVAVPARTSLLAYAALGAASWSSGSALAGIAPDARPRSGAARGPRAAPVIERAPRRAQPSSTSPARCVARASTASPRVRASGTRCAAPAAPRAAETRTRSTSPRSSPTASR